MQIGIIGLPGAGKTTVFNALTKGQADATKHRSGSLEPNVAVVKVPDERLDVLAAIFKPKRIVQANVEFMDVGGITRGSVKSETMGKHYLGFLANMDSLLHVVRAFESEVVPHPEGSVDPLRDSETMDLELSFWDLEIIERRLARISDMSRKVKPQEREANDEEAGILRRLKEALEDGKPVRQVELTDEEKKIIRGFQFLTEKPLLVVLNVGEDQLGDADNLVGRVEQAVGGKQTKVLALAGELEMEIAQLPEEDARDFLADAGLTRPGSDRVIQVCYELLDLVSFLTGGPDEVRAWPITRGAAAPKAAGAVHSDIEKGFIRAEVVSYEDLVAAGSMAEVKKRGQLRLEGKTYVVQDGDVVNYLFNV